MMRIPLYITFLLLCVSISVNAQTPDILAKDVLEGPTVRLTGEVTGLNTIGLQSNDQAITSASANTPGIYVSKKNSYYANTTLNILFNPVSTVDVYAKLLARYRPGSPYIPLQLAQTSSENFTLSVDSVYGRVNVIKGLGSGNPLGLFIKMGKYDTAPSNFQSISRYGVELVLSKLRTNNIFAIQIEATYPLVWADSFGLSLTTNPMWNEAITRIDSSSGTTISDKFDIPLHLALKIRKISTPLGPVSTEFLYVYNAQDIYSGNNFGLDAGWEIKIPDIAGLTIPVGLGFAFYEKNIDPFAASALDTNESSYFTTDPNDQNTTSFRQALRTGCALGLRYIPSSSFRTEFNAGYAISQVAHAYRETIIVNSLSLDMRLFYKNSFFIGGGLYLGTLANVEWKTNSADPVIVNYSSIFRPRENMGYEAFAGIQLMNARFVIGYNCNRGLSMGHTIESISDGQVKYLQKGTSQSDNLYEAGGIFTRLTVSW
ncbi:MAG: hypothetical protein FWC45_02810 [Treponema sp.]|nr:hypothetical protein [Treponema sp.]